MASKSEPILIVGCGPGSADYVTPAARDAARSADALIGSGRLLELFPDAGAERVVAGADVAGTLDRIAAFRGAGRRVAVLVSGDPGVFSLSRNVIARFGLAACRVVSAVSSVQVAFARLGLDWADARIVSAHGRTPDVEADELAACDKIAILAGTADAMGWAGYVAARLAASHEAYLCENLTLADERVRAVPPEALAECEASSLAIVVLVRRSVV